MACGGFADIPADGIFLLYISHTRVDFPGRLRVMGLRGHHDRVADRVLPSVLSAVNTSTFEGWKEVPSQRSALIAESG
jgi:hypothetical protein